MMKQVKLNTPRVIGGVVRYPSKGVIPATADEAKVIEQDEAGEIVEIEVEEQDEKPARKSR